MRRETIILICLTACLSARADIIPIETDNSSMILVTDESGKLLFRHYGGRIADPAAYADYRSYRRSDYSSEPLAYPSSGGRYYKEAALSATYADGACNTELVFDSCKKEQSEGKEVTSILLKDPKTALEVRLVYEAFKSTDVIVCHSEITNGGKKPVTLHNYYSSALSIQADKYLLTHFYGSWAREMQVDRELLTHGTKSIETKVGVRATHMENPSFMLSLNTETFDENYGEVIAGALAWSGNFKLSFQLDETDELIFLGGVNPYAADYTLAKGESLRTPDMAYTYSNQGAGKASRNLHDWARQDQCYSTVMAPTLLNSWEGAYFDFNTKVLTDMIDDAARLGLEMFVLDDGWFGNKYPRSSSLQGLGDWDVTADKLPEGIDYIASYAHGKGLKFGIWIEPEMVNPKSELYEKHPDWIIAEKGRELTEIRHQYILDLSNPAVQDFVFGIFDRTMQLSDKIDYIKWDCNRHFENVGSTYLKEQTQLWVKYTQGYYSVLKRIRGKYPDVLIQDCASGGGRVDYGALAYTNEFWTSDDTEARERARIQYGTSLIYPAFAMGSHVSAVPNHQTGNNTPIKFRFDIAGAGRLGMELQPKSLNEKEYAFAKQAIESYKQYRDIVRDGDLYRLLSPYDTEFYSLMYVSKDKKKAVVFAYCLDYQSRTLIPQIRLKGLDGKMKYKVTELNVEPQKSLFWGNGKTFPADYLAEEGINPHLEKIYSSCIFYLEAE